MHELVPEFKLAQKLDFVLLLFFLFFFFAPRNIENETMRDKRKHRFRKRKPPVTARTKQNFHFLSIDEPLTRFFFFSFFFLCFILREQCILRQLPFRCFIIEKSRSIETKTTPTPRIARDLQYSERFSLLQKRKKKKRKRKEFVARRNILSLVFHSPARIRFPSRVGANRRWKSRGAINSATRPGARSSNA